MKNAFEVFKRSWYTHDNGTGGSGAKVCTGRCPKTEKDPYGGCSANSYVPTHSPGCDVVEAANEFKAHGFFVDVSL